MKQLQALRELAEKVEANKTTWGGELIENAFNVGCVTLTVDRAYLRSLDAAHSLHKAVLGDRWTFALYDIWKEGELYEAQLELLPLRHDQPISGRSPTPARAWLLAIIKAKIAELE